MSSLCGNRKESECWVTDVSGYRDNTTTTSCTRCTCTNLRGQQWACWSVEYKLAAQELLPGLYSLGSAWCTPAISVAWNVFQVLPLPSFPQCANLETELGSLTRLSTFHMPPRNLDELSSHVLETGHSRSSLFRCLFRSHVHKNEFHVPFLYKWVLSQKQSCIK